MPRKGMLYQCKTCGGIMGARERRAHLNERHHRAADALATTQVNACFTTTIDPMHPGRADKWNYTNEDIRVIMPDLKPLSAEENSDA